MPNLYSGLTQNAQRVNDSVTQPENALTDVENNYDGLRIHAPPSVDQRGGDLEGKARRHVNNATMSFLN